MIALVFLATDRRSRHKKRSTRCSQTSDVAVQSSPNTSLEPTAYAVLIHMSLDSSITVGVSLPRLPRLWLSLIR